MRQRVYDLDHLLQLYLKKIQRNGQPVTARIAMATARGHLLAGNCHKLEDTLSLTGTGLIHYLMNFIPGKLTTSKSKHCVKNFAKVKTDFLQEVVTTVEMEEIPPELILNWGQTGIKIVPITTWTMEQIRGSKRVEFVGTNDKRQITAVFCAPIQGNFHPVQLIYMQRKLIVVTPSIVSLLDGMSFMQKINEETTCQYIEFIIFPYVNSVKHSLYDDTTAGLIIMDNFKGQVTANISKLLEDNNLHVCLLPPNTTDLLQLMDLAVNKPAKSFLKNEFSEWYSKEILQQLKANNGVPLNQIELDSIDLGLPALKEFGAQWLVKMVQYIEDNPQFVVNGFIKAGISRALDNGSADLNSEESSASNSEGTRGK